MDGYYDKDEQIETACKLFEQYVILVNQEFRDDADIKKTKLECITIATKLIELGFIILVQVEQDMETIALSDHATQTVLIFIYDLLLIPNVIPIQQPIMDARAVSKVFGPPTLSIADDEIREPISAQQETWLHSILDNLGADKTDKNSLNKERD